MKKILRRVISTILVCSLIFTSHSTAVFADVINMANIDAGASENVDASIARPIVASQAELNDEEYDEDQDYINGTYEEEPEEDETSVEETETSAEDLEISVEESETSVEESETSVEETETSVEELETVVEESETSVEESETTVEENNS